MGRDPTKKPAIGIRIPSRCQLKCRNRSEIMIATESGGMLFLCEVDANTLRDTGKLPKNKVPNPPKEKKA